MSKSKSKPAKPAFLQKLPTRGGCYARSGGGEPRCVVEPSEPTDKRQRAAMAKAAEEAAANSAATAKAAAPERGSKR